MRIERLTTSFTIAIFIIITCASPSRRSTAAPDETADGVPIAAPVPSTPEIYLTGFILRDALNGNDVRIRLTGMQPDGVPIAAGVPFRFNHGVSFHIRQEVGSRVHDFEAALFPDGDADELVEGEVQSSLARVVLRRGWAVFNGASPVGETNWGTTSADGTSFAIHIGVDTATGKPTQTVYNLEPAGSQKEVRVTFSNISPTASRGNQTTLLGNQHVHCVGKPTDPPPAKTIAANDRFVREARRKAREAKLGQATTTAMPLSATAQPVPDDK